MAATQLTAIQQIWQSRAGLIKAIAFVGPEVKKDSQGGYYTKSLKVELALTSPFGFSSPYPIPTPLPPVSNTNTTPPIPSGVCTDNPCASGEYCVQIGLKSLCIGQATASPSGRIAQGSAQDFNSQTLLQIESLTQASGRLAAASSPYYDLDIGLLPPSVRPICADGSDGRPEINFDVPQVNQGEETRVFVDNATRQGWNNNCQSPNPGDSCSQSLAIPVEPGQLYNLWMRTEKDDQFGLMTPKYPIICGAPKGVRTLGYRLAEDLYSLKYSSFLPHYADGPTLFTSYVFQNIKPGLKTVWVQFLGSSGQISSPESAQIKLDYQLPPTYCIQVLTEACTPDGSWCKNFPTPCEVPPGWIPSYPGSPKPLPGKPLPSQPPTTEPYTGGTLFEVPLEDLLPTPTPREEYR